VGVVVDDGVINTISLLHIASIKNLSVRSKNKNGRRANPR
jgi:hypothetical protein